MAPTKNLKRKSTVEDDEEEDELFNEDKSDEEGSTRVDGIYIPPPPKPICSIDTTGSRLIITKITNYFFKSYAQEQTLGPFHKCFNAIVGPNGSGKSNVIDAMLFVFGYRASKIRSKKISVLLHNSEHYSNVKSCTVGVHFAVIIDKVGEDYEVVPNSEFVIARTAHKDNSSFYEINSKRVQFKEVAKMLRNYGVDLDHNRFLILQGEVEQIAMMKCKAQSEHETGMLEYLEDIIGTSRFKVPIVKLEERVELLADQRAEKLNRVKLVEKELNELKKPMEEAVEFLKLENSITSNKNFLFQYQIHTCQGKIKQIEEEKTEFSEKQKELDDKLKNIAEERGAKEMVLTENSKKYEDLQKRKDKIKEAYNIASNRDVNLQADMVATNTNRKKTKKLLEEERKKLDDFEKTSEKNAKTIEECVAKEQEMTTKKEKLEIERTKLQATFHSETVELQQKMEVLGKELAEFNIVVREINSAASTAESKLKLYLRKENVAQTKLESLQASYKTKKETITNRTKEVNELKKKIPLTEKSLSGAKSDLATVKLKEYELIEQINRKRTSLAETKSTMQKSKSRGRVLDSLTKQKRDGNCPGLFGRLGDLGAIDLKYDVAVSTACGPLDNIVVDSMSTAHWCVDFLKEHNIGRATFISLDQQEHLRKKANSTIKTPENVPRLFDLIQIPDDRMRTAFYYALRDTLVAENLEQASRIAYGNPRFRTVSLQGHLIELTGTMSGGGKTVSRGRMGQTVAVSTLNPKDVEKMEVEVDKLEETIRQLQQKQTNLENQINTLEPELHQMKKNLESFSCELESAKEGEPDVARQVKEQEVICKSAIANPAEVKKLTKVVNDTRLKYEEAVSLSAEKKSIVEKLVNEIKEKTTGRLKPIEKSVKECINTIDKCKKEMGRLRAGIAAAQRNAKTASNSIIQMEQDIVEAEGRLREMKQQREEIESDATQLLATLEKLTSEIDDGHEDFAGLKGEVAALTKQETEIKLEKIDVDGKCKTFDESVAAKKAEVHSWRAKLKQLKLQDVPDQSMEELKSYNEEELINSDLQAIQRELNLNEEQLKAIKPNLNAISDYRKKLSVFVERSKELDTLSEKKAEIKQCLDNVKLTRKDEFVTGYNIIRIKLKEMYQMITLGGDADFEMVDTFDPFTEGIQFNVRPPKKSWKNISNLSGGEKTLSSLALVFALHYYKPSPLYVMDEIDAALDFKNVSIVGNYIKERTKNAQFIIISLRSNMFELCDHLIGIYKTFNCTKTVCIDPRVYDDNKNSANAESDQNQNNPNAETDTVIVTEKPPTEEPTDNVSMTSDGDSESQPNRRNSNDESIVIESSIVDASSFEDEMEVDSAVP